MKKHIVLFLLLMTIIVSCKTDANEEIKVVSQEEMQTYINMDDVQLIDVRTPKEYNAGHIATAQNINFLSPTFEQDILKLDKNKPVLVYCQMGGRSAKCAEKMKALGFTKILDYKDGYSKWKSLELPIEK
ncbi:MAG TPA: rhodanese-like domain-containing protein [Flavobacteriaceae bacterium]|nr:rhodanese-like domain-containing protein [Flavobacteriaceae bacterium]